MSAEQVSILDFMMVRAPLEVERAARLRRYIRDDELVKGGIGHQDVDLQSTTSPSEVARMVVDRAFVNRDPDDAAALAGIRAGVLDLLPAVQPGSADLRVLEERGYWRDGDTFHLLPDRLRYIAAPMRGLIPRLQEVLVRFAAMPEPADDPAASDWRTALVKSVIEVLDGRMPAAAVYDGSLYAQDYAASRRALFDAVYLLYVARRWTSTNFEPAMDALRVLHALRELAIDDMCARAAAGTLTGSEDATLRELVGDYPALRGWNGGGAPAGFPLVQAPADLRELLDATPVVHPVFAQLIWYGRPFNRITPLGVGDLKLVYQQLIAYEAGEISDIHNVMLGETKERLHRRLERTEETFSSSSTSSTETSTDTSSTDRFELKREVESVVKQDLNVNASLRAQYDNKVVLVAAQAGFAYTRNSTDQQKLAQNYSREVVDKAVTRVQNATTTNRSTVKLFESEETNKHQFANANGDGHVSGIYRWVDKRYRAQIYNYGKRLMFEFVLPEPAAFLVESRLRDFEATLDLPVRPTEPEYAAVDLGFTPTDITDAKFAELRETYDLSSVPKPPAQRSLVFRDDASGNAYFAENNIQTNQDWYFKTARQQGMPGYQLDRVMLAGDTYFRTNPGPNPNWKDRNIFDITVDGTTIRRRIDLSEYAAFYRPNDDFAPESGPLVLTGDEIALSLGFQNVSRYHLEITAQLSLGAAGVLTWQQSVYDTILGSERQRVQRENDEKRTQYDAAMTTYRNRLADIRATVVNELLQGRSEAYNNDLITTELRRQCLAMFTKDFDADGADDLLTDWSAVASRSTAVEYRRFTADEENVGWSDLERTVDYPLPDLPAAKAKGRYVQFLEQAFEWGRLGYVPYPYFWAESAKWIDLMNRTDDADPAMTAFLRAGAVKVLIAVTPAYESSVLHFLATREPWEGGPAPVIGDPLYLPLFEELHRSQDDRRGATAEGEPWTFTLPTALVYLEGSLTPLPTIPPPTEP